VDLREIGCEDGRLDETGSGSCPVAGFGIRDVEISVHDTTVPVICHFTSSIWFPVCCVYCRV